ncbi:unnamed protein product [Calicophoron daubneyi]|uniref:Acyltransferase n=1 Tax=Calicophoron daubneyi TaxID=300641 RepID=A0AAV2T0A8_CALDB
MRILSMESETQVNAPANESKVSENTDQNNDPLPKEVETVNAGHEDETAENNFTTANNLTPEPLVVPSPALEANDTDGFKYWLAQMSLFNFIVICILTFNVITLGLTVSALYVLIKLAVNYADAVYSGLFYLANYVEVDFTFGFFFRALLIVLVVNYVYYWFEDTGAEEYGGHRIPAMRRLKLWNFLATYFPVRLVLSRELIEYSKTHVKSPHTQLSGCGFMGLPADKNYLVGYHPHGMICAGAAVNFLSEATGFSSVFPNLQPTLAVLKFLFSIPFFRDLILASGCTAATEKGMLYLLDPAVCGRTGNFVVVVIGGAPEVLESWPGHYGLYLKSRYGFFRLALQTGSALIPTISFGETNIFDSVTEQPDSYVRRFQKWACNTMTKPFPMFYGNGFLPYRTPINTVIGPPIECEKVENPTRAQVEEVKTQYIESLKDLFKKYRPLYDPKASDLEFI